MKQRYICIQIVQHNFRCAQCQVPVLSRRLQNMLEIITSFTTRQNNIEYVNPKVSFTKWEVWPYLSVAELEQNKQTFQARDYFMYCYGKYVKLKDSFAKLEVANQEEMGHCRAEWTNMYEYGHRNEVVDNLGTPSPQAESSAQWQKKQNSSRITQAWTQQTFKIPNNNCDVKRLRP